jgi:hypothetical protein
MDTEEYAKAANALVDEIVFQRQPDPENDYGDEQFNAGFLAGLEFAAHLFGITVVNTRQTPVDDRTSRQEP